MIEVMATFLVLNSLSGFGAAVLQGLQEIRFLSILGIISEALTIPVMFLSLSAFGLLGAVLGGTILVVFSAVVLFGSAWRKLKKLGFLIRLSVDKLSSRTLLAYVLPLLGSAIVVRVAFLAQSSTLALDLGYDET